MSDKKKKKKRYKKKKVVGFKDKINVSKSEAFLNLGCLYTSYVRQIIMIA